MKWKFDFFFLKLRRMDISDLPSYQFQLQQVEEALAKDPENAEFQDLQQQLTELIALIVMQQEATATASSNSSFNPNSSSNSQDHQHKQPHPSSNLKPLATSTLSSTASVAGRTWSKGQTVMVKYTDGKFYEAIIDDMFETEASSGCISYKVTYSGYNNSETVKASDIKDYITKPAADSSSNTETAAARAEKKKKYEEAMALRKQKRKAEEREIVSKQSAWQSFAQGPKKGKKAASSGGGGGDKFVAIAKKKSMFATPDDPNARVGVIGSGKPPTQFQQRSKHVFSVGGSTETSS